MSIHKTENTGRQEYDFVLILDGIAELTEEIEDAFYEAGCGDALLGIRDGVAFLDFSRQADSLERAIESAKEDIARSGLNVSVVDVKK